MKDAVKCWMSVLYCSQCQLVCVSVSHCVDISFAGILFIEFETVSKPDKSFCVHNISVSCVYL